MKIEITAGGIYGAKGEIPIGTELTVKEAPVGWAGRYRVIGKTEGKTAVVNPKQDDAPKTAAEVLATADGNFMAFKSGAKAVLGDDTPAKKDEIVAALVGKLTDAELKTFLGSKGVEVKDESRDQLEELAKAA